MTTGSRGPYSSGQSPNARTTDPPFAAAFVFTVDGVIIGSFTEVTGLAVSMTIEEITEGGNNESTIKVPGRLKFSNIVLKRGITSGNELFDWISSCSGSGFAGNGNKVEKKTGSIALLDSMQNEVRNWQFRDAMPVRWTGPQFAASSAALAVEELEVCHGGFTT